MESRLIQGTVVDVDNMAIVRCPASQCLVVLAVTHKISSISETKQKFQVMKC